jgi:hypothetical protein
MKNKKGLSKAILIIVPLLIVSFLALASLQGADPFNISGSTYVKPIWGRLSCEEQSSYKTDNYDIEWSGTWIDCASNEFTDKCEYKIIGETSFGGIAKTIGYVPISYTICDKGATCFSQKDVNVHANEVINLGSITKEQTLYVWERSASSWFNSDQYVHVENKYKPWNLVAYDAGAKRIVNSASCTVPVSYDNKIMHTDYIEELGFEHGPGSSWINYVTDWVYGPGGPNVGTYQGNSVYCTAGNLYEIVKVTTADGKIRDLSPEYYKTAPDGDVYKGLGSYITSVECCPSQYNCGNDFEWITPDQKECTRDADCKFGGAEYCISATKVSTGWNCVNDKCVDGGEKEVECCLNTACPSGQICSLAVGNTQYTCIQQEGASYCGDGRCNLDETPETCPADCGAGASNSSFWLGIAIMLTIIIVIILAYFAWRYYS